MFLISVSKDYYGAQQILPRRAETPTSRKQLCSQETPLIGAEWSSAVFDLNPPDLFCI